VRSEWSGTAEPRLVRLTRVSSKKPDAVCVRLLARNRAARSHTQLLTDDTGVEHETAQAACRALGLLDEAHEAQTVLEHAMREGYASHSMLRSLFVQLIVAGHMLDAVIEIDGLLAAMHDGSGSDDGALNDIAKRLLMMGIDAFRVLPPNRQPTHVPTLLEMSVDALKSPDVWRRRIAADAQLRLDGAPGEYEQTDVVHYMLTGAGAVAPVPHGAAPDLRSVAYVRPSASEHYVLFGDAGAGKSRVIHRTIAELSARSMFARVTAIGNLPATAFENGTTVHKLFNLHAGGDDGDGNYLIDLARNGGSVSDEVDAMLSDERCARLIIDEGVSGDSQLLEAVVLFMRRYRVRVLIVGDGQQLAPVVPRGSVADVVNRSVLRSTVRHSAKREFVLRRQQRARGDLPWAADCATLATATAPVLADHPFTDARQYASAVALRLHSTAVFVHRTLPSGAREVAYRALFWLFGRTPDGKIDTSRTDRYVLVATNTQRNWWNENVTFLRQCDYPFLDSKSYYAVNTASFVGGDDDGATEDMAMEALRDEAYMFDHADHAVPLSTVELVVGDRVMLPMTVDSTERLVKNRVVIVRQLESHAVVVEDVAPHSRGRAPVKQHVLCRQRFKFGLTKHLNGVEIRRLQIPVQLAWAISVNKSQGQSIPRQLLDLRRGYWQHGSGYVAPSRCPTRANCAAYVDAHSSIVEDGAFVPVIRNVVYPGLTL